MDQAFALYRWIDTFNNGIVTLVHTINENAQKVTHTKQQQNKMNQGAVAWEREKGRSIQQL